MEADLIITFVLNATIGRDGQEKCSNLR